MDRPRRWLESRRLAAKLWREIPLEKESGEPKLIELALSAERSGEGSPVLDARGRVVAVCTAGPDPDPLTGRKPDQLTRAAPVDAEMIRALWDTDLAKQWVRFDTGDDGPPEAD